MNIRAERDIMGESEQCGNTALTHISDLTGGHQLPDKDSTRLSRSEYRKQWRQTPWGKKTEKARSIAASYQRGGKLTKQPCEVCGDPDTEKHHEDYDYALDVRWLCHEHHRMVTAGEIKLEPRKPCLLPLPDRSESIMLGRIAKKLRQDIDSATLAKMREYAQHHRRIMIQEANGIFTEKK